MILCAKGNTLMAMSIEVSCDSIRRSHEVPGMRGLYAHASDRMRGDLKATLQAAGRIPSAPRRHPPVLAGPAARRTPEPFPAARAINTTFRLHQPRTRRQQALPDRAARHREAGRR